MRKENRKIDIYSNGIYAFSTRKSETCRQALRYVKNCIKDNPSQYGFIANTRLSAYFSK